MKRLRSRDAGDRSARPPILRSIRTRLAVAFFLVTALSVAVIYVVVAPPLTSGLQNQRVSDLFTEIKALGNNIEQYYEPIHKIPYDVQGSKALTQAEHKAELVAQALAQRTLIPQVSIVNVQTIPTGTNATAGVGLGSYPVKSDNPTVDAFAESVGPGETRHKAADGLALVGVGISKPGTTQPITRVVVYSAQLTDVSGAVSLVRSRVVDAAALGLLVALLTGVLVARALTVRVLRLERTAQRVAQGDFEAHFSDASGDELGQLAAALAHMQSQLEGLDSARRRFIATASHELRTPIFSLGGFLELIQDEQLDEDTRQQFLGQVRDQVERLGTLATQLLDLSRLESGSVELESTPTDLGVLARAVGTEFGPAVAAHGSRLSVAVPEEPIRAICDSERVAQLLRILIDNALAHTPQGTDVLVSAHPASNGTGPKLSVHDGGPGIPEEALQRIFEPFYSADGTRGAGLGLAIAHELAVRMQASLDIASAPGDTTFTLTLPGES
ncbi:MAG TPA: HAMP domain-containing sensor histidine kinase [Solirubrobacteraceae bacterium]|nr:HAMP domain-containing sensor histidine kinase [Solirubrobacteraceae bacterium]